MIDAFIQKQKSNGDSLCCCCYLALAFQLTCLEKGSSLGNSFVPNLSWSIALERPISIHYQEYVCDRCCQTLVTKSSYFFFGISNFQKGKTPRYVVQAGASAEARAREHLLLQPLGF